MVTREALNMNDGAAESGRGNSRRLANKKSGADDFVQALAKIAVAQVFDSLGFQGFQQSALNVMSDVAVRYIRDIGKISNLYSDLDSRNNCDVLDVIQALKELGSSQGFTGASDVNHFLANSGIIRELIQYVHYAGEIAFAYSVPCFPVSKDQKIGSSFMQLGETPPDQHIPDWLPAFPDIITQSPEVDERGAETNGEIVGIVRKHKNPESFLNLQQMLSNNGSEFPVESGEKRVVESNLFVTTPLHIGEKEVLENTGHNHIPLGNHYSVFDTLVPVTGGEKTITHEGEEQESSKGAVLQSPRPLIQATHWQYVFLFWKR